MNPFYKAPHEDPPDARRAYLGPKGLHLYFRHMNARMQARFAELVDHTALPCALIHGNPHLDNYTCSQRGAAMVDFDRSRIGPCAYDICRFLISAAIRGPHAFGGVLPPAAADSFRHGYERGLRSPASGFDGMAHLERKQPKPWQTSTATFMAEGKGWAARVRKHAVDPKRKKLHLLLVRYLASRNESDLLDTYRLEATARVPGSMGKVHYLYWLVPKREKSSDDHLLLDVKETYDEPNTRWYYNPFAHQGQRMIAAGELYCPGWNLRPGWATHRGKHYWGRQIPPMNLKLKRALTEAQQLQLTHAVGTQLGRAHQMSVLDLRGSDLFEHFRAHYPEMLGAAQVMQQELEAAYRSYVRELGATGSVAA